MNKACETGDYREVWQEMAGCDHCGTCVRWDLKEHPFFGFASNCPEKHQPRAIDPPVAPSRREEAPTKEEP